MDIALVKEETLANQLYVTKVRGSLSKNICCSFLFWVRKKPGASSPLRWLAKRSAKERAGKRRGFSFVVDSPLIGIAMIDGLPTDISPNGKPVVNRVFTYVIKPHIAYRI